MSMQRFCHILFAALGLLALPLLSPSAAMAQDNPGSRSIAVERWVEEWDPAEQRWVRVSETIPQEPRKPQNSALRSSQKIVAEYTYAERASAPQNARYALPLSHSHHVGAIAQYGPFQVLDGKRAAVVGPTGPMSPRYFAAMLHDFPNLESLEMIEAPGTSDDIANLRVGRMIRAAGLATHVPNGGSVRSGAVELFLAGTKRTMDDGAEFAVHSWLDSRGREPKDFAPDAPENRLYLDYYREMGMSATRAKNFYAMTNSVPHRSAKWLGAAEMRHWLRPDARKLVRKRRLALDFLAPDNIAKAANDEPFIRVASLDSLIAFP